MPHTRINFIDWTTCYGKRTYQAAYFFEKHIGSLTLNRHYHKHTTSTS